MRALLLVLAAVLLLALAACGGSEEPTGQEPTSSSTTQATEAPILPQGDEPFALDPADFVTGIDNLYWPMTQGSSWVYRETDRKGDVQKVVVTVTDKEKMILGIPATVVHDVVTQEGKLIEDTLDWYAQDRWGNVWYLGEETTEYEDGKASTAGSWEAGVDGAQAGVLLPGQPEVGVAYRQEYYEGEAEDAGEILSLDEQVEVPFGSFDGVLMTKDWTPLEPQLVEHKFYAKGTGPVLAVTVSGGSDREELLSFRPGG